MCVSVPLRYGFINPYAVIKNLGNYAAVNEFSEMKRCAVHKNKNKHSILYSKRSHFDILQYIYTHTPFTLLGTPAHV